jgi:hypothetical protein
VSTDAACRLALAAPLAFAAATGADTIVQEGSLSGKAGPPTEHVITLDLFDTMGGTRELNFVRLDLFITLFAEAVTNGSGGSVDILASLSADYSFVDGPPIAGTEAIIDETVENVGPPIAYLYLDEDMATVTYDLPDDLAPWIGVGTIDLMAVAQMIVADEPPGVIEFSAAGSVTYTATYDYDEVPPCPADLDGDGSVGIDDLLRVLSGWGGPGGDVDGDGTTDIVDLLAVLAAWGQCSA